MVRKLLLVSGILSSLHYIAINIYVPLQYEGYNITEYTVSELSAIGAPTRQLWLLLALPYPLLFAAFAWGVVKSAAANRLLNAVGVLMLIYAIFNAYWPPMHQRGIDPTLTDVMHISWAGATVLLMLVMMGLGAAALGKTFRWYTIASMLMLMAFGTLTALEAPNIATDLPTPFIGIWERINIGVFMVWVVVLSVILLRSGVPQQSIKPALANA